MRDVSGHAFEWRTGAIESLSRYLGEHGYAVVDPPLLEDTELFVRKSGGELTSRLYSFVDPGGNRVSLRPEFTSSVIRHFVEEQESLELPVRWQYQGPVFRYESGADAHYQFWQVGAELVGVAGAQADAELVGMAWRGLAEIGLSGHRVHVGHIGLLHRLLDRYGLSESARLYIIANVGALKNGAAGSALKERAEQMGLLGPQAPELPGRTEPDANADSAREFIQSVLSESLSSPTGSRTPEQIISRLMKKERAADDPSMFSEAVALAAELAACEGPPAGVIAEARGLVGSRGQGHSLDELEQLVEAIGAAGVAESQITVDLGLARGIAYYTGVIFELSHLSLPAGPTLGGGGRYDGLVRALGGDGDVPALGFAYNLDRVVDALHPESSSVSRASVRP